VEDRPAREREARISFETPELLWKVLTTKCWELLKAIAGQEPMTIRDVADRVGRDVKAVHSDVATWSMPACSNAASVAAVCSFRMTPFTSISS
jgi:predicted transcriptional regulator